MSLARGGPGFGHNVTVATAREQPPDGPPVPRDVPSQPGGPSPCPTLRLQPDPGSSCAPIRETAAGELDALYRFAVARLGGKAHMAQDVVQQALLIALAHRAPPDEASQQRAWLRGVIRNVIRREFRSRRRARHALDRHAARQPDPSIHPASASDDRARAVTRLFLAVTELDQADQDLFYAFYKARRSHAAIASDLGTTSKGVEARLYRMRSRLRAAMESSPEHTP